MKPLADLIATPTRPTCRPTRTTTRFCIASADDAGAAPRGGSALSSVASGKLRLPAMAAATAGPPPSPTTSLISSRVAIGSLSPSSKRITKVPSAFTASILPG